MPESTHARGERYERARSEFDHLRIEDKAIFLLEATVSTMARALEDAGHALADEIDSWFRPHRPRHEQTEPEAPPASRPPTSKATRKANQTKKTSKKTVGRKKSSGKSSKGGDATDTPPTT